MAHTPAIEQTDIQSPYWTVSEAADYLRLGKNTVYTKVRGDWRDYTVKIGGRVLLRRDALIAAAEQGRLTA
jgi:excisionase family DNA binding protein